MTCSKDEGDAVFGVLFQPLWSMTCSKDKNDAVFVVLFQTLSEISVFYATFGLPKHQFRINDT